MNGDTTGVAFEVRRTRHTILAIAAVVAIGMFAKWRSEVAAQRAAEQADIDRMIKRYHDAANEAAVRAGLPTLEEDAARAAAK